METLRNRSCRSSYRISLNLCEHLIKEVCDLLQSCRAGSLICLLIVMHYLTVFDFLFTMLYCVGACSHEILMY